MEARTHTGCSMDEQVTTEYKVTIEEEMDDGQGHMRLLDLIYKPGCGMNLQNPLEREFIRPPDHELTSEWLNLVSKNLVVHGPYVQNFDREDVTMNGLCAIAKAVLCTFDWDAPVPTRLRLLGVNPAKHRNVMEAVHEMACKTEVQWEKEDGSVVTGGIGEQWMWSIVLASALIHKAQYEVSFIHLPPREVQT